jgi:rhodanese-related sulfurtransferase
MADGDEVTVGDATVRAVETPGHTPEHTSYAVLDRGSAEPSALFTGGSLTVGGAGRTDLLGPDRADELTRAQFRSLRRLVTFGPGTRVLPTHGAGSFCAASAAGGLTSTVGAERLTNPALALLSDEEEFVRRRLQHLPSVPAYCRFMAPINRAGPALLSGLPGLALLSADAVAREVDQGAWVVDARDRLSFAQAHVPGSLNVELDDAFASYVGSVVPFGVRLVLLLPEPLARAAAEAVTQLLRIGYDGLVGCLAGGLRAWQASGRAVASYPACDVGALPVGDPDVLVLDVRQPAEVAAGTVPGSRHIVLGDLPQRISELSHDRTVWTICASGRRAAVAASLLARAGFSVAVVAVGGVPSWAATAA